MHKASTNNKKSDAIDRQKLLNSFKSLQTQFDGSLNNAKKHEKDFENLRQGFMNRLSNHFVSARQSLPNGHPLKQQVLGFIDLMDKTRIEWDSKVAGREKGAKFREGFDDSLLVFINGKVKSGKSSLGNYIAWGHTDPDENLKQQVAPHLIPEYFSHEHNVVDGGDAKDEAQQRREFRVGAIEATSSIQGFKLPGLTWVDSPGIHSVKKENEKLARDYVEHADLVLYTMSSNAVGRASDLKEIQQLMGKDKKILLLLTGSDEVDEDVDETGGIVSTVVMKGTQEKQHAYVREALKDLANNSDNDWVADIEIVSISARYAQLNADDPAAFTKSGMELLCTTLHRIAQSEGVRIKLRTPIAGLYNFLQSCHDDLIPYRQLLLNFKKPLIDLKQESDKKLNNYIRSGQAELVAYIDDFFDHLVAQRDNQTVVGRQLRILQKSLNDKFQELASERLAKIFEDLIAGFQGAIANTYRNSELVKLPDFKMEQIEEKIPVVRSGTKKRNLLIGTLLGGTVGFMLGGPAGAALGASLGGSAGELTGNSASINYRSETFTVGDNLQEIRQQAIRSSETMFEQQIRQAADSLWSSIELDVEPLLGKLTREITEFEKQLNEMLHITKNA